VNNSFEIILLGTNGSCAFNSGSRQKYGTNTPCVVVRAGDETLIFDAGTGICEFRNLPESKSNRLSLFFSHFHMDHVCGLLFCSEFFDAAKTVDIYGNDDVQRILNGILSPPLSPVDLSCFKAATTYHTIGHGVSTRLFGGITVHACTLSHPGGTLGYRVEYGGKVFCYCSDVELKNHQNDAGLQALTHGADLLLMDSAFMDEKAIPGWGHSSPTECAEWALRVKAKQLALSHYGHTMTDADIDAMADAARRVFPNTFTAADGMRVEV